MVIRVSAIVAALCVTVYWGAVLVKLVRLGRKIGKDPNAVPREVVGILMRVPWYGAVIGLLIGVWVGALGRAGEGLWTHRLMGGNEIDPVLAALGAATAVMTTALTFVCWRKMGRSWRIGIDPGEKTEMVSAGPYRWVRHPIYALRMILGPAVFVAVPTAMVGITIAVDLVLLQIEARREEAYMVSKHGESYRAYQKKVGRFLPRLWAV